MSFVEINFFWGVSAEQVFCLVLRLLAAAALSAARGACLYR
ncbi:hypothetical protein SAMN02927903_02074 [Flavobacterium caeni]|uniref:Uncharacterized protein n=1 Tax=Flavobacterium caeni TaxID=490189 RepID=A0A1G5I383_9FLAO|nr:hypothetical protein SAMN02927903_02074 [Flavobacterium caeni]